MDAEAATPTDEAGRTLVQVAASLRSMQDSLRTKDLDRPELVRGEDLLAVVQALLEVTEALDETRVAAVRADKVAATLSAAVKPSLTKKQRRRLKKARTSTD